MHFELLCIIIAARDGFFVFAGASFLVGVAVVAVVGCGQVNSGHAGLGDVVAVAAAAAAAAGKQYCRNIVSSKQNKDIQRVARVLHYMTVSNSFGNGTFGRPPKQLREEQQQLEQSRKSRIEMLLALLFAARQQC